MVATARMLSTELVIEEARAELSGPDEMYVPTTQIRIQPRGCWHRRSAIATETACGLPYFACASREYELSEDLCPMCFTIRERWLAAHPDDVGRKT